MKANRLSGLLLFLILIATVFRLSARAAEPSYNGKALSEWLVEQDVGTQQDAIRQIGTNGIPTLFDIVGVKERTRKKVLGKLKSQALQQLFRDKNSDLDDLRSFAVKGFVILGTNASSAFPRLVKLLDDPETRYQAARTLLKISPEGFTVLTNALASQDDSARNDLVWAIGHEGGADTETLTRLLINSLKDPNWSVRGDAADFLAGKDAALAVPALIPMLDDSEYYPRARAAIALASFGPAAKSAAPKLLSVYTNVIVGPDRKLAFDLGGSLLDALRKTDREAAGQAETFIMNDGPLGVVGSGWTDTLLQNGKKLIAGGSFQTAIPTDANHIFPRAQLFDSTAGKRTDTGSMNVAREFHMAVLLSNGKVLVMGGENLGADGRLHDLTSAEIYDPATGQWTETGSMNSPHPSERAALQPNGKVLVYEGGFDGYPILGHELYDPATGTWSVITNK